MHNNVRNRALLDLAYEYPCMLRIDGICEGGVGEPAHSNQSIHGKGGAMKAHDNFHVPGCRSCHRELDQGHRFTRAEKFEIWNRAYWEYQTELWRDKKIKVA